MTRRVFGITGWKNSGKTALTAALVTELGRRGHLVSTVKHAHHAFDIDRPETDSFRHREAGAMEVAIVSGRRWALMHELRDEGEPSLADVLDKLAPCDLVLVEGYKHDAHPKLETRRLEARSREPLTGTSPNIVAIAADHPVAGETVPVFGLGDITAIADFVETTTGLAARGAKA
ncbi:molybdopterin-guanine dinucleotide biosynthesis protein B [Nitratireductor sp. CAU 1489]|uniref:Molybdopterin-guanine dinucleotide biosynthesis protein B n=1 Tax=Nitratireductor arenosus TaxID=2682096 RepID=A0A844QIL2_9HYPH|nr:molybdopterin-guanine dinucleotide biosynthesis protein B [Nitratireductor arenosus]MVA97771.1 molybdopterin-guanine dinucleotide biosynthesis protein B [Nitratireductor arenosus]